MYQIGALYAVIVSSGIYWVKKLFLRKQTTGYTLPYRWWIVREYQLRPPVTNPPRNKALLRAYLPLVSPLRPAIETLFLVVFFEIHSDQSQIWEGNFWYYLYLLGSHWEWDDILVMFDHIFEGFVLSFWGGFYEKTLVSWPRHSKSSRHLFFRSFRLSSPPKKLTWHLKIDLWQRRWVKNHDF